MKAVNREQLLQTLSQVSPGLSTRDIIEQSSCFIFKNREVITFNDEVACRIPCDILDDQEAAVPRKIMDSLSKLPDEVVNIELKDGKFTAYGKNRKVWVKVESETLLPVDQIEKPTEWKPLPTDFCDAVHTVCTCASRDEGIIAHTCVNITPEMLQARDDSQACRWKMDTGFTDSCLVRQTSLAPMTSLGVTHFNQSVAWIHFKNETGLIYSARQWKEDYPDLKTIFSKKNQQGSDIEFTKATLSRSIAEVCERAEEYSKDNTEAKDNRILVDLKPGRVKVTGEGITGGYEEKKKVTYQGKPMSFYISPKILSDIVKRHTDLHVADDRIRVNGGNYIYVTGLDPKEEKAAE